MQLETFGKIPTASIIFGNWNSFIQTWYKWNHLANWKSFIQICIYYKNLGKLQQPKWKLGQL